MYFFGELSSGLLASYPRLFGRKNILGTRLILVLFLFFKRSKCEGSGLYILNGLGARLVDYIFVCFKQSGYEPSGL